jgi:polar amino acid transport system substrate-binding protein
MKLGTRQLTGLVLSLILVAAACGGDDDDDGTTTAAPDAATTAAPDTTMAPDALDEFLVEPGTLTLATTGNFPPFTLINADTGDVEGYSVAVGAEVASRLGLEYATPTVDFVAELEGLQSGLYDIADSGIWPTEERQETFIFTRPMTSAGFIALVRAEDAGSPGLDAIAGNAGAIQGSIHEQWTIENQDMLGYDEYVPFAGAAEAELALKQGRIDVWVIDSLVGAARALGDPELDVTGPTLNAHPLSMTFRPDSEDLRDAINPVLDEMIADGTLADLQVAWFGRCVEVPDDIDAQPPYTTLPEGDCP